MRRTAPDLRLVGRAGRPFDYQEALKQVDMFFQKRDPVHKTMNRIVKRLEKAGIPYVVVGGMAVVAHKYERTTNDVDLLLTPEGFAEFQERFVPKNYRIVPNRPKRFVDKINEVTVDILVTGGKPGWADIPTPIRYPDPSVAGESIQNISVVNLATLIEMKLAARRSRDFADVVELIRANDLDESFRSRLHPTVRSDYIECLEEKRRDDEYEARHG